MTTSKFKITRLACFMSYFTMSSVFCVPPLLFMTFRELYGISYTLLGSLVLINFFTQLGIDLIFTAFSKHFNPKIMVRIMPLLTAFGLFLFGILPVLFPEFAYLGLLIGTIIFSLASGLSEVLLSPTIAAIPSDNPGKDMSLLHSLYAFGTFTMIIVSTLFLKIFGIHNWIYLIYFLSILPIIPAVLFMFSPMPDMSGNSENTISKTDSKKRKIGLLLCLLCIFFGSCSEVAMSSWISTYIENALGIDKTIGDILGAAMFAVLLGLGRIFYAKYGKSIFKTLLFGMIGAAVCYIVVGASSNSIVALIACALTGLCTSMLWPGTLIMMEENIKGASVAAFALMASGGDLGASVSPQLLGFIVDKVSVSDFAANISSTLNITPEQTGLKIGMLITSLFSVIGIVIVFISFKYFTKQKK